jgi:hypothetical protein
MGNNNLGGQIIGEIGEIAKDVTKQVAQLPKDIVGSAMESLGTPPSSKPLVSMSPGGEKTAWERIDGEKDNKIKRSIARRALEELANRQLRKKEPSIWERLQQEQEQKKGMKVQQNAAAAQQLQPSSSKRARGDLYGAKAKTTATENRNVRQD